MTGKDFSPSIRRRIEERSGGVCEGCLSAEAVEFHHRQFKSRGGLGTIPNALHLCGWGNHSGCHGKAHSADPPEGWAVHSWDDPRLVPVLLPAGLFYLTNGGFYAPVDEIPEF